MLSENLTITELLLSDHSKKMWEYIAQRAIKTPADLEELMACFFGSNSRLNQRSSQCISKIHDIDKTVIAPYFPEMIEGLNHNCIDAYKRNVLRIFQDVDVQEEYQGKLFDLSLSFLLNSGEAIAIKAFAMTVLRRISEQHPELSPEVIEAIEIILEEDPSAGLKSRGKKELKKLNKLSEKIT